MDAGGFLPVTLISSFRRVQSLSTDVALIITAIKESDQLELVDGFKVRCRIDPTKWPINADVPMTNGGGVGEIVTNGTSAPTGHVAAAEAAIVVDTPAEVTATPIVRPPVKSTILSAIPPPPQPRNFRSITGPKVGEAAPVKVATSSDAQHHLEDLNPNVPEFVPENLTKMKDVVNYESNLSDSKNVKAPAPLIGESVSAQNEKDEAPSTLTAGEFSQ
jgi:la-related protein 1